jgi:hypothetical protein
LEPTTVKQREKRLTLNLSADAYAELSELARLRNSSMTEVVRLALGLVRIAITEKRAGNKLMVTNETGQPKRELVLP